MPSRDALRKGETRARGRVYVAEIFRKQIPIRIFQLAKGDTTFAAWASKRPFECQMIMPKESPGYFDIVCVWLGASVSLDGETMIGIFIPRDVDVSAVSSHLAKRFQREIIVLRSNKKGNSTVMHS